MQGQLLRQLQAFAATAQPSYLPTFTQRAQDFHEGVQALVYDVLMLKVTSHLCPGTCQLCYPPLHLIQPAAVALCSAGVHISHARLLCRRLP